MWTQGLFRVVSRGQIRSDRPGTERGQLAERPLSGTLPEGKAGRSGTQGLRAAIDQLTSVSGAQSSLVSHKPLRKMTCAYRCSSDRKPHCRSKRETAYILSGSSTRIVLRARTGGSMSGGMGHFECLPDGCCDAPPSAGMEPIPATFRVMTPCARRLQAPVK